MRRLLLVAALLAPLVGAAGCSSTEPDPGLAAQDSPRALDPAPLGAPADSPPLSSARPKIAPEAALASGERKTIR